MKKSYSLTIGIGILVVGVLLLGVDRIFISAASGDYFNAVSIVTTISLLVILIGVIWLFRTTLK